MASLEAAPGALEERARRFVRVLGGVATLGGGAIAVPFASGSWGADSPEPPSSGALGCERLPLNEAAPSSPARVPIAAVA
jgi:hypothetical protein